MGCDERGCGLFGPETMKKNPGVAKEEKLMKDLAEIAKKEEEFFKTPQEPAWVPRPLTAEEQARARAGSGGLSSEANKTVMRRMPMKKNGKGGGGSSSRTLSASTPTTSRRRPETFEIGIPNVKRGRELWEGPIGTPTTAGASRPLSSEAEAGLGEEGRGGGGFAPVPADLDDTDSTFEKELLAASKRVEEAANARPDVATVGKRAPESPGKVRRVEGGFGEGGGGGVSPTQPFFPETQGQGWPLTPTQAVPNPCDDVSRWGWSSRGRRRGQELRANHFYYHNPRGSLWTNHRYQPRQARHRRTVFRLHRSGRRQLQQQR